MKHPIFILAYILIFRILPAQSDAAIVEAAGKNRLELRKNSVFGKYPARNIGPTQQGGRITDIEAEPGNSKVFYVAYASGGVFKTTNNGQSFVPIFDGQTTLGIGDIALSPSNPQVIWVGTGESNSSRSSYAGAGVWRSEDGGKTWKHKGLTGTQHIGRVVAHPTNPNVAWVAAIGALYTENEDRGVFKTTDGGNTWHKTLYVNAKTGVIDLAIDPNNPDRLLAASWERYRKAWAFDGDGLGSGIWRSEDGGEKWTLSMNGVYKGDFTGRIGLAFAPSSPAVVYALVDDQETDPKLVREDTIAGISMRSLLDMKTADFMKLPDSSLNEFLREKEFPKKYDAKAVKADLKTGKYGPKDIANYFGDANEALFNTGVKGATLYKSVDGGKSWKKTHQDALNDVYYTYGYYFGMVRVAPDDADEVYIAGVPLLRTTDGGVSWDRIDSAGVHVDHHTVWMNPKDGDKMILGNDGGLYMSYDRGSHFTHLANLPVGQFYTVAVDMDSPYNVYGGLQDNGVQKGSSKSVPNKKENWEYLFGGDGMCVVTDPKNKDVIYTGYQFGNYFRLEKGKSPEYITPRNDIGTEKYRWNWRTPLIRCPHNHEILYIGSQYLFRSMDMGENWEQISPDLSTNKKPQGNVPYSTITAIAESPLKFGLIWAGTDDGNVQLSTDAGSTWTKVGDSLPQGLWVSYISASPHDKATAYICLTGYRNDDFRHCSFVTTDLGRSWRPLKGNLPDESANVLIEDPAVSGLLYLGTDHGSYLSLDGGKKWEAFSQIPNVATYDMVVHPREPELVVATHGRSIYIVNLELIRAIKKKEEGQQLVLAKPSKVRWSKSWGEKPNPFTDIREPKAVFQFFVCDAEYEGRELELTLTDSQGKVLHSAVVNVKIGFNELEWNLLCSLNEKKSYLAPGTYKVRAKLGFEERSTELKVEKP